MTSMSPDVVDLADWQTTSPCSQGTTLVDRSTAYTHQWPSHHTVWTTSHWPKLAYSLYKTLFPAMINTFSALLLKYKHVKFTYTKNDCPLKLYIKT